MAYSDFDDEKAIESVYCTELENYFEKTLGAKKVRALDYQLRRRDRVFPDFGGKLPPSPQPSLLTHVDVTAAAAKAIVEELYKESASQILRSRYQIITIWRPLRVPVSDWPLAICDAASVDQADLIPSDVLYPKFIAENRMVHFNEGQRWYWLPDHAADEVIAFRAVDSENPNSSCPHGAFPLREQGGGAPPRESIDVRLLVMYANINYPEPKI